MVETCWCCGQECMFCFPDDLSCDRHWCAECKYSGCDWCCGCPECQKHKRGGWSPKGVQVCHGGAWERVSVWEMKAGRGIQE